MAETWNTPVTVWTEMPLEELHEWIQDANQILKQRKKERDRARQSRK